MNSLCFCLFLLLKLKFKIAHAFPWFFVVSISNSIYCDVIWWRKTVMLYTNNNVVVNFSIRSGRKLLSSLSRLLISLYCFEEAAVLIDVPAYCHKFSWFFNGNFDVLLTFNFFYVLVLLYRRWMEGFLGIHDFFFDQTNQPFCRIAALSIILCRRWVVLSFLILFNTRVILREFLVTFVCSVKREDGFFLRCQNVESKFGFEMKNVSAYPSISAIRRFRRYSGKGNQG